MVTRTQDEQARFSALRGAYFEAFHQWSRNVRLLQSLAAAPASDQETVEQATRHLEQAWLAYRESRDALARFMLSVRDREKDLALRSRVQRLAHQIWEQSGRPSGRAEEHWCLAEQLTFATMGADQIRRSPNLELVK